jgi:succinate dehydrogenase / fumarate reductase flavoprotein subunit
MAYQAGLNLEDPEFLQFHPTGLIPSGILMTEGCRGEGGYLKNKDGKRFMEDYAAKFMELAPRDIVSRSEMTEILGGRGFEGPDGLDYVHLDLTHLGADKINKRLPLIREVCIKFLGIDPITHPIPIRPVAHYSMGGVEADINGRTQVENIWAAGEVACHSLHGANRLGCNSTAECLAWGGITGEHIAKYMAGKPKLSAYSEAEAKDEETRVYGGILQQKGEESPYKIRRELRALMDKHAGVYREGASMQEGLDKVKVLRERFARISVQDKGRVYNSNLMHAMETANLLELAEVLLTAALAREESRGGHARRDFTSRDDERFLKHTLVARDGAGKPRLAYKPVTLTHWKPVERKY